MVMVLDQGRLVEVGSPDSLMGGEGIFAGMARAAGLRN
jgi:ABC-type multidrug transport system fused ATPase/permease subunit